MRVGFSGKQKLRPAILEEEDLAKTGMGAVLNMARRKGFLDQEEEGRKDMGLKDLICKDYKIDDKSRQVTKLFLVTFVIWAEFLGKIKRRMIGKEGGAETVVHMAPQAHSLRRKATSRPSTWSTLMTMAAL